MSKSPDPMLSPVELRSEIQVDHGDHEHDQDEYGQNPVSAGSEKEMTRFQPPLTCCRLPPQ